MAYTADDLARLRKAIAIGAERVRYADRDVTYRSLNDMWLLEARMTDEVEGRTRTRQIRVRTNKGF